MDRNSEGRPSIKLTAAERERMHDSLLKIQSVRESLDVIDRGRIPNSKAVEECLETADQSLKEALGYKQRD